MTVYARITTDPEGHVTPGSTCTIDGETVPLPTLVMDTDDVQGRVEAAIGRLGWEVVDWDTFRSDRVAGWFEVLVDLPGSGA